MTGSDTSSNAFFSKLHVTAAQQIGVDPVVLVAANSSGGVCGKMISPQSIAVATSATNLVGKEGDIFRFSLKHSLLLTTVVGIMVTLQAYVFKWMIPAWEAVTEHAPAALHTAGEGPAEAVTKAVHSAAPMFSGSNYLVATFVIALVVAVLSMKTGKLIELTGGDDEMHVH